MTASTTKDTKPTPGITLEDARQMLEQSRAPALLKRLESLPAKPAEHLAPLVFDAISMSDQSLGVKLLRLMIKIRPQWINQRDEEGNTPLLAATALARLDAIAFLLAAGAQVELGNKQDLNALDVAAYFQSNYPQQKDIGEILLASGRFNQEQKDYALLLAARTSNLGMVRALVAYGARLNAISGDHGTLVEACISAFTEGPAGEIVGILLDVPGAEGVIDDGWDKADNFGAPIHTIAASGRTDVLRLLIDAGACVNPPPGMEIQRPRTPLMRAATCLCPQVIKMLIDAGADASLVDSDGDNALHYLVRAAVNFGPKSDLEVIIQCARLLIDAGADPEARSLLGHPPAGLARASSRPALANAMDALASSRAMAGKTNEPAEPDRASVPRL